jgi:penicillin-binding protein 1B
MRIAAVGLMLSGRQRPRGITLALSIVVAICGVAIWAFCAYIVYLNHRLSAEMLDEQWKTPIEIYSSARPGQPFVRVYGPDWRTTTPVEIETIPPHVANAFLAAEDVRFRHHLGVDPVGIARALFANLRRGSISQGGSTIDQQLIKTKFLTQERTMRRKIVEMMLAVILDARLSKDEILEAYLNDVYLGHFRGRPVLGIDEAARLFFDKSPARLDVDEAALLAGIIRAPNRDTPDKRPDQARARRDAILRVMKEEKWIDDREMKRALAQPVLFHYGELPVSPYQFSLSVVRREVIREIGEKSNRSGGLKIYCEIDPRMQQQAERAARRGVATLAANYSWIAAQNRAQPLQVAMLSVDPVSGGIRAIVGGSDPQISSFDRTIQMRRQPGSAFKTFAYFTAIQRRQATPATLLLDAPLKIQLASNKTWEPHNYDEEFRGRVTLREAFEKSLNVPTVRLSDRVGSGRIIDTAKKFGFQEEFPASHALSLGVTEVTMRELTGAYTAFPNLGKMTTPYLLARVVNRRGKTLYEHRPHAEVVADKASTYVMHSLLRGVVKRGTASRLRRYGLSTVAGKTGTTSDYRDAWFVGYTRNLVTTVWVGFDNGAPLRLSSGEAAIPIWGSYMSSIPLDREEIEPPSQGVVFRQIDPESGFLWQEGCPGPFREAFLSGTAPTHHCPAGLAGRILRRVLFDNDSFDEPAAITFDQFRQWAADADQQRQAVENRIERLRRLLHFFSGDNDKKKN